MKRPVVIALSVVALAVAAVGGFVFVQKRGERQTQEHIEQAKSDTLLIHVAVSKWRREKEDCPELRELDLGAAKAVDPWGMPYEIRCYPNGTADVFSRGEDGKLNTADDIKSLPH